MNASSADVLARFDAVSVRLEKVQDALRHVVFGQDQVIEEVLVTLLCGGHGLLVGTPGLADVSSRRFDPPRGLALLIGIGVYTSRRTKSAEDFFLGGRGLGPWVASLSASLPSTRRARGSRWRRMKFIVARCS